MAISTAVSLSAVARVVGIQTRFVDLRQGNVVFLPQHLAVIGQGASSVTYATTKIQLSSAGEVGERFGYGSPLHLAAKQLFPVSGDGVGAIPVTFFPLEDDGSGVAADATITPTGTATKQGTVNIKIAEVEADAVLVEVDDTAADVTAKITSAINAVLDVPALATDNSTDVGLAAKWAGESGNDLTITIDEPGDLGITFGITNFANGATNPDVQPALDQFGNVWYSMVLNCLNQSDTTALDAINAFGEGRWGALTRKPFVAFNGVTTADVNTATTLPDSRASDRINGQLPAPGSNEYPAVVAARQLARIIVRANNNPAYDYGSLKANGIAPGTDGEQWDYPKRDQAVKAGSSTIEVRDGVVNIGDVVTFYHPSGEAVPPYRYLVDIVKLQNIIFNLDLIFVNEEWDGAPLVPNDQAITNRAAKRPKDAVTAINGVIESLGLNAIISDPDTAKTRTVAGINEQNPKRLDARATVQLAGNTNIKSVDLDFGFYFGVAPLVA